MQAAALEGGFADVPVDAAHAFRQIMNAMARPGLICDVAGVAPPAPLSVAAGVVILTLCDPDTPVYLSPGSDNAAVRAWITFHTGAPFCSPVEAQFAVGVWDELPIDAFALGTAEYPDRSTTLIVERPSLDATGATLRGPGIKDQAALNLPTLDVFQANAALFPLGLDFIFTCQSRLAALPRTTKVS